VIFLDTNVVSETLKRTPEPTVLRWLEKHDAERALSMAVIAELTFGISKIRPDQRAQRLADGLEAWRSRFAGGIFAFTEEAALSYGELMGEEARKGRPMSAPDGMIAAIARVHSAPLATRNVADFRETGVAVVDPWRG
jgi:predicted nucleic acid-binding protein